MIVLRMIDRLLAWCVDPPGHFKAGNRVGDKAPGGGVWR